MKIPAHISASHRTLLVGTASPCSRPPPRTPTTPWWRHARHARPGLLSGIAHRSLVSTTRVPAGGRRAAERNAHRPWPLPVPLAFVVGTVAGTLHHLGAADLPMTETVIALSVLLGGRPLCCDTARRRCFGGLFGVIGVFHGYAYGESIVGAESTPLLSYLAGFALIQFAIIVGGVKASTPWRGTHLSCRQVVRYTGLAARRLAHVPWDEHCLMPQTRPFGGIGAELLDGRCTSIPVVSVSEGETNMTHNILITPRQLLGITESLPAVVIDTRSPEASLPATSPARSICTTSSRS